MSITQHVGGFVTYEDHVAEMEKLRESVRRLVGEWRKQYEESDGGNDDIQEAICADELSALIDGKDSNQEKL